MLKNLLDVDEDLALMQLTELKRRGDDALEHLATVDVEDIELLMEAYLGVRFMCLFAKGGVSLWKRIFGFVSIPFSLSGVSLATRMNPTHM